MFANDLGVPEDPATGSAAGCLAAYLLEHSYLGTDAVDVRVEQGYEIGRPSLLYLKAERAGDEIMVDVGGKVQMVARGELV
jgi:trans-2,3-dihydro-3-hydroxyanthranilate isomerase